MLLALHLLLALTCLAWLWGGVCLWRMLTEVPRLDRLDPPAPPRWPRLSVVVPACDEEATLPAAAATWRALDYPDLQVLLVDDRSQDGTPALADDLDAADPRLTAVHVTDLPEGWLGKPHAMQRGLDRADGEWILFTDADVHLDPDVLRRAVAHAEQRGLDFLAVLPDVPVDGFLLNATVATFGRMFMVNQRLWKISDPTSKAAAGVGAFNLVRRTALEATEGLPWLAMDTVDDLALGLLMKRSGARCDVAWSGGLVRVAWYETLPAMVRGMEKNTYAMAGCSLVTMAAMTAGVLLLDLGPLAALAPGFPVWLRALAAAALVVGVGGAVVMARFTRRPLLPALAVPLGTVLFAWTLLRAAWLGARRGGIRWRGTFYPAAALRRGRRVTPF